MSSSLLPLLPSDFRGVGIRSFCAEWVTMYCHAATLYFLCFSFKNGVYIADDAALVDLSSLFVLVDYLPRYQTLNHLHNGWLENPYRKLHLLDYSIRKRKADKESSKLSKSQCQNTFPHYHKKTFYRHGV